MNTEMFDLGYEYAVDEDRTLGEVGFKNPPTMNMETWYHLDFLRGIKKFRMEQVQKYRTHPDA